MTRSRNTLRWDQRETNQEKSQRWELWVDPWNEWVVKRKTGGWEEDKVKILGWGGWEDWPGDSCGKLRGRESLEESNEEGIWKPSFFLANNTLILSSSTLSRVLQEVFIQQCNYELIMLNKKLKTCIDSCQGTARKVLSFPYILKRIP